MKKHYNQPEVQVARIALKTIVLAESPTDTMGMYNIEGDQW